MLEWLKRHAWKACNRQNRFAGSNPVLSASFIAYSFPSCRRRAVFFCILYSCCPHLRRVAVDNAKLIARCPHRRLRLPLSSLFTKTPRFHDFTFSRFHDFVFDENTTISHFHIFTFSRFHLFTFSPHQSPETMLSPLISPPMVITSRR